MRGSSIVQEPTKTVAELQKNIDFAAFIGKPRPSKASKPVPAPEPKQPAQVELGQSEAFNPVSGPVVRQTVATENTKAKPTVRRAKRGTKTKKFADEDEEEEKKAPATQMTNSYVPSIAKPPAQEPAPKQDQVDVPDFLKGVVDVDPNPPQNTGNLFGDSSYQPPAQNTGNLFGDAPASNTGNLFGDNNNANQYDNYNQNYDYNQGN